MPASLHTLAFDDVQRLRLAARRMSRSLQRQEALELWPAEVGRLHVGKLKAGGHAAPASTIVQTVGAHLIPSIVLSLCG
ncbi:hypothetical protein [Variovorax sp. E3]|uniref:hypothetical protein n=1 Tax=Variovorax sp. E3 TaxID=1914993 RepID=UPI0022B62B00|nr:hypothetical protein [Variovorax sp. E3]